MKKALVTLFSICLIMILALNVSAASVTYYQTSKSDVQIWSASNSKSKKVRVVSATGTVLKVVDKTTNSSGNIWYKLNDGTWVYSGNVKKHEHSYSGGICTGRNCGYEYPLNISSMSADYIVTNNGGAKVWSKPYSTGSSVNLRTEPKNKILRVTGKVSNAHGNLWYRISDGKWVYSDFIKRCYSISYNANGGFNAPAGQTAIDGTPLKLNSGKPSRVGYTFQGWSKSSSSSSVSYNPGGSYKFSSNTTLYAVWKSCSHDYDANGGFCKKCNYEFPLKIESMNATFKVVSEGGAKVWSKPYSTGKSVHVRTATKDSVITVVGKTKNAHGNLWYKISDGNWMFSDYIKQCYTISFNANGGSNAPSSQTAIDGSSLKLSSSKPSRVGYTFQGWSKSSGSSSVSYNPGGSYKFSSNTTLYAVWKSCSHDYDANGGFCKKCNYEFPLKIESMNATFKVVSEGGAKVWSKPYSTGKSVHVRTATKDSVITVVGKTKNAHGNLWYKISDGNWMFSDYIKQCYTISFNANGGSNAPSSQTAIDGSSLKLSSSKPSRVGYTFQGWSKSSGSSSVSYNPGGSYKFSSNTTLYAVWKTCGHDYEENGGICKKCGYEYQLKVDTLNSSFKVTNSGGAKVWSKPYSSGKSVHIRTLAKDSVVTVVGKVKNAHGNLWYKISDGNWIFSDNIKRCYTITYHANGGVNAPSNQTAIDGVSFKITSSKPARVGYTFQGWSKSSGSSSVSYNPGGSYKFTSNTTLYAVWKNCSHDYDKNGGFCNKCNYEYPLKVESLNGTFKVVSDGGAKVWSKPYSTGKSVHIRTVAKNTVVTVVGKTKNAHGNLWYQVSDGNWIYSDYIKKCITITFNANGGKGAPGSLAAVSDISTKLPSTKPQKVGYAFQGWATSSGSTKVNYKAGTSYKFSKDLVLYAVWGKCEHSYVGGICKTCKFEYKLDIKSHTATYVVTNTEGAKTWNRPYDNANSTKVNTLKYNDVLTVKAYTMNQHDNKWYQLDNDSWVWSGNVTRQYSITYDAKGGDKAPGKQVFLSGKTIKLSTKKPIKEGYEFKGWSTSSNADKVNYKSGASYSTKKDLKLYAVWGVCGHNYKDNGGVCKICGYEYPLKIEALNATFKVSNKDGAKVWSKPYSSGNSKKVKTLSKGATVTVVGKAKNVHKNLWYKLSDGNWVFSDNVKEQFKITYDANTGKNTPKAQTFLDGEKPKLTASKPTKAEYIFEGWAKKADAKKVDYVSGAEYTENKSVTLYAVWNACKHDYSYGVCTKCKFVYPYETKNITDSVYVINNSDGAYSYKRPYMKKSERVKNYKKNSPVVITHKTTISINSDVEWFKLRDGNWIKASELTKQTTYYNISDITTSTFSTLKNGKYTPKKISGKWFYVVTNDNKKVYMAASAFTGESDNSKALSKVSDSLTKAINSKASSAPQSFICNKMNKTDRAGESYTEKDDYEVYDWYIYKMTATAGIDTSESIHTKCKYEDGFQIRFCTRINSKYLPHPEWTYTDKYIKPSSEAGYEEAIWITSLGKGDVYPQFTVSVEEAPAEYDNKTGKYVFNGYFTSYKMDGKGYAKKSLELEDYVTMFTSTVDVVSAVVAFVNPEVAIAKSIYSLATGGWDFSTKSSAFTSSASYASEKSDASIYDEGTDTVYRSYKIQVKSPIKLQKKGDYINIDYNLYKPDTVQKFNCKLDIK